MKSVYAYVRSRGIEEEDSIPFPDCKVFEKYWYPVDPTSLSANFTSVFPEVARLIN